MVPTSSGGKSACVLRDQAVAVLRVARVSLFVPERWAGPSPLPWVLVMAPSQCNLCPLYPACISVNRTIITLSSLSFESF